MASQKAINLKANWMEMSDDCFEPLTFGELEVGQSFIVLPDPGDNSGHGGLRVKHWTFTKTQKTLEDAGRVIKYSPDDPHGIAINKINGTESDFPHSMFVILIE